MRDYHQMVPETPAVLIDKNQARKNLIKMAAEVKQYGCTIRPHAKTHKISELGRLQIECGGVGLCCAKVSEAEAMADGGATDIFIAYPMVGDFRIIRAAALAKRIRLILAVDSEEGASALSHWGKRLDMTFEVRIEIDTGLKRTGVKQDHAVELAQHVAALPNLHLTGIFAYRSLTYNGEATGDCCAAGRQEGEQLVANAQKIRAAGIPIQDVSGGSTPTSKWVASVPGITEVRPGTHTLNDYTCMVKTGCALDEIAAVLVMTVVSTPEPGYAVVDGGSKALATDFPLYDKRGKPEYAYGFDHPDLVVNRVYEEHGMICNQKGGPTGLQVGDRIAVVPAHICTSINLYNYAYLYDTDGIVRKVAIDGRGQLQ